MLVFPHLPEQRHILRVAGLICADGRYLDVAVFSDFITSNGRRLQDRTGTIYRVAGSMTGLRARGETSRTIVRRM